MSWNASPPRIEIAATWIAAACLGGSVAIAVGQVGPFGTRMVEASVAGVLAAVAGWALIGGIDRRRDARPIALIPALVSDATEDDVLLLDDPILMLGDDSRVVRLFAVHPGAETVVPRVGPGEMFAQIEKFLDQSRGRATPVGDGRDVGETVAVDASVALHAALADIRRSLRQA